MALDCFADFSQRPGLRSLHARFTKVLMRRRDGLNEEQPSARRAERLWASAQSTHRQRGPGGSNTRIESSRAARRRGDQERLLCSFMRNLRTGSKWWLSMLEIGESA